ncbi:MAG TPA: APC family permease [Anaerolineales bacterium]|nr:APC family permease [Anaerolineales bacterium]HLF02929.1 APC family permease [Anaerolineales bacterium]
MTADTHTELKKDALSTWDVISQALAFLGPVMSMSFLTAYIAMAAGSAVPLAVLFGGLTMVALGYVVAQFATRVHAAGAIYNYAAKAFGPSTGFMGGWVYLFAVLCLTIAIIAGVAGWTTEFLSMIGVTLPSSYLWLVVAVVECAALFLLSYFDVRISTKTQLWLVFGSVAVVVVLALYVIAVGGASGHSGTPFSFSAAGGVEGLTFGMIFAILMYTGFESAAVLAEETSDPKRSMPIAIVGTVAAAVVLYIVVTYAYSIGFGFTADGVALWADPASPALFSMAGMYVGDWLVAVVFLAAIVDGFAVALGCLTTSARVAFAIARDGALPGILSHTHPKYKTPHIANGTVLALALIVALGFAFAFPPAAGAPTAYTIEFGYLAGIGAIAIEVIYVFVSIAAMWWFYRELKSEYNVVKHLVIPIVAIVGAGAALYGSLLPQPDPLMQTMPYVALAWIVFGLLYIVLLRFTRPGLVAQIGRDLGTLDVPEPVDVRFQHDTGAAD